MEIVVCNDTSVFLAEAKFHNPQLYAAVNEYYDRAYVWYCVERNQGAALWTNIRIKGTKLSMARYNPIRVTRISYGV